MPAVTSFVPGAWAITLMVTVLVPGTRAATLMVTSFVLLIDGNKVIPPARVANGICWCTHWGNEEGGMKNEEGSAATAS